MHAFLQHVNAKYYLNFNSYSQLHEWSCEHPAAFWEEIYQLAEVKGKRDINVDGQYKVR